MNESKQNKTFQINCLVLFVELQLDCFNLTDKWAWVRAPVVIPKPSVSRTIPHNRAVLTGTSVIRLTIIPVGVCRRITVGPIPRSFDVGISETNVDFANIRRSCCLPPVQNEFILIIRINPYKMTPTALATTVLELVTERVCIIKIEPWFAVEPVTAVSPLGPAWLTR